MNQKTLFAAFAVLLAALIYVWGDNGLAPPAATPQSGIAIAEDGDSRIAAAYRDQISGLIVETSGVVARVLPDDNQGSRHQRFILRLRSGQTVLVSHNNNKHSHKTKQKRENTQNQQKHNNEEAVAAMQRQLPALEERLLLTLIAKTTAPRHSEQRWLPYRVRVVAMDHPGIVHRITDFFSAQKINIEELETATYAAPHTVTPMFSLTMTVAVPAGTAVARLREGFIEFCDGMNLDASLEAARG